MLSGALLKQFRTYLKSQVGHGWSVEGRKSKGRLFNFIRTFTLLATSEYCFSCIALNIAVSRVHINFAILKR